jgi:DHA2 family multidrug resistance protein-like MFS transporter
MLGGIAVAIGGIALVTRAATADGPGLLVAGIAMLSLGLAPLFTLAADLAVGSAPPERAGAASGISETSSELGGALGLPSSERLGRPSTAPTPPARCPPPAG